MTAEASPVDRPEFLSATVLTASDKLFRLTPYWQVAGLARTASAHRAWRAVLPLARHRQPPSWTVAVLILGVPPYAGFVLWMLHRVGDAVTFDLRWRMWLAGLWILISPGLIVAWERRFVQLHAVLLDGARTEGWSVDRLVGVDRIFARLWWPFVGAAAVAILAGYVTAIEFLQRSMGAAGPASPYFWLGLVIVAAVGASFGVGVWGVAKTLVYARVALDSELMWDPFRPKPPEGFEELSSFTYWTGLLYSIGSVVLPGTFLIVGELPLTGRAIGILFAGCLLFGGAAVFILPSVWMSRISRELRITALDRYTAVLNQLDAAAVDPLAAGKASGLDVSRLSDQIAAVTALRALVAAEQTAPSALWIGARTLAIFVVPIIVSAIQTTTGLG